MTSQGAKPADIEGMSQLTFHSQSNFGRQEGAQDQLDGASDQLSQTQSVYTKPFTVQSNKGSERSKMQPSLKSGKPGTEVAKSGNIGQVIKKKDR